MAILLHHVERKKHTSDEECKQTSNKFISLDRAQDMRS